MTRFVLHPGEVNGKYFTGLELAKLYGVEVPRKDWYILHNTDEARAKFVDQPNDIHLYPRSDGNYNLVKANFPCSK